MNLVQPAAWIFDLDGTLVDTVETRIVAWLRTFEEQRIPANRALIAGLIGSDGRRLARVVAEAAGPNLGAAPIEENRHPPVDNITQPTTNPHPTPRSPCAP